MKKGDPLGCINKHSVAKYQTTRRGVPLEAKKSEKSHSIEKKLKRGPLVSSGFVGYVLRVKNERGILCTKFPMAGLGFSSFCKKWTFQCEVCGLEKKRSPDIFSLKEKAPTESGEFFSINFRNSQNKFRKNNYSTSDFDQGRINQ